MWLLFYILQLASQNSQLTSSLLHVHLSNFLANQRSSNYAGAIYVSASWDDTGFWLAKKKKPSKKMPNLILFTFHNVQYKFDLLNFYWEKLKNKLNYLKVLRTFCHSIGYNSEFHSHLRSYNHITVLEKIKITIK